MNRYLILISAGVIATSAAAAGKLDMAGKSTLRSLSSTVRMEPADGAKKAKVIRKQASEVGEIMVRAFLTCEDTAVAVRELEEAGAVIDRVRGNVVMAQFPVSAMETVEALESVKKIRIEKRVATKLDKVRPAVGIDKIHSGEGLPRAFTGKGVVAGIVDGGFDPNHINFKKEDGSSRIGQFTFFRAQQSSSQLVEERYPSDYIPVIDTENDDSFHATHTTGIMAGSYRGDTDVAVDLGGGQTEIRTMPNPYYGIAYDAEIATASAYQGQLSDYYIAMGVESILDYAYDRNMPAVINLSLGNNVGPHDGTSPICEYLDQVIMDPQVNAHVCIAAGNEGEMPIAVTKCLTSDDLKVGTGIYPMYDGYIEGYKNPRQGQFYIYSDSQETFEVQVQVINTARNNRVAKRMVLEASPEGGSHYWVSEAAYQQDSSDIIDKQLGNYFHGYVGIGAETDEVSGRYYAVVDMTLWDNVEGSNPDGTYLIGIEVTGSEGQRIDFYGDGSMCSFTSYGVPGYSEGGFDGTINDIATGHNAIVVGSYNTRDTFPSVDGFVYGFNGRFPYGGMSPFTSYGTLIDGRTLPDVCAPGATVISSSNEYYLDKAIYYGMPEQISAIYYDGARNHSYHQCSGTSMACPVVTGALALWLEAYPELTAAQAKEIIRNTALKDEAVATSGVQAQWGAGKFDAYAGLKEVLRLKEELSVGGVSTEEGRLNVQCIDGRIFEVLIPDAELVKAELYSAAGRQELAVSARGNVARLDANGLPAGIYFLRANNVTTKIILK